MLRKTHLKISIIKYEIIEEYFRVIPISYYPFFLLASGKAKRFSSVMTFMRIQDDEDDMKLTFTLL